MEGQIPSQNIFSNSYNKQCTRKRKLAQQITLSGFLLLFFALPYLSCKKNNSDYPKQVYITVTGVKPLSAKPGDTITITGTHFNPDPSGDTVKFNGNAAHVQKATSDTLNVIVPKGNTTGVITVNGISAPGPAFTLLQIGVTGFIPAWGKHGDTILITGTNFYLNPSEDTVMISGVNATVLKASADTLHVIVPITSTGAITINGVAAPAPDFIYEPTVFVTTLVGPGSANNTNANGDGPDSIAIINPVGLWFDKQSHLFVSNGGECIREISNGFVSTISCTSITGYAPNSGIVTDVQNNIYFTDGNGSKVRIIKNGIVSDFTNGIGPSGDVNGPLSAATFYYPGALAIDVLGNLYVAEPGDIRKISPDGTVSTFAGKLPTVDSPNSIIPFPLNIRPSLDYPIGRDTAARFGHIGSLATDTQGNVYAGDLECQCVKKITPDGTISVLSVLASYNYRDSYNTISGICTDAAGNIYVSRQAAIYKITPLGVASILAGKETSFPSDTGINYGFGFADGPAAIALFSFPTGLACDAQGNVYVADTGNGRIRKISFQ